MAGELAKRNDQTSLAEFGGGGQRMRTSLDLDDKSKRGVFLRAQQDCDARLVECVNQPIHVTDYLVHEVELTDKGTGEVTQAVRLVLIDKDGLAYETVGKTFLRSFQRIAYGWGEPPWPEPKVLIPKTRKKGEMSIYWFDVQE